ncbi:hypothetical protein C8J56DRAFT_1022361 [Mycena floridula]|nr:hypothetical protein C8J56DRAFT_1022361 [Mycena floridula]
MAAPPCGVTGRSPEDQLFDVWKLKSLLRVRDSNVCSNLYINSNDLYCTIKAGGSAADIEWHLTELRQEAVEGKRCASELQTRFHEIKALGVVTRWWQELIGGLDQIDQWAKKDANQTMKLIDDQKYLGLRFRAYVSQMMNLQDRYPLSLSRTKKNRSHRRF